MGFIDVKLAELDFKQRNNPLCVISKEAFGEYSQHDIQTNSSWSENPYGESYAVVADDLVSDIVETLGYCDIVLNDDGTEVVSFTARDIPTIPGKPETEKEPTTEEVLNTLLGV